MATSKSFPDKVTRNMGCDPEVFILDNKGIVVPAWERLGPPENKGKDPFAVCYPNDYRQAYWDGFQAEFTTYPRQCLQELASDIRYGLQKIAAAFQDVGTLSIQSVVEVPEKMMAKLKLEHYQLGCNPSLNAYEMCGRPIDDPQKLLHRFAGGHIHMGLGTFKDKKGLAKFLDQTLGVCMTAFYEGFENKVRREYYGLPGEYRSTSYGIEYRTLSNTWLMHPVVFHMTFELARFFTGMYTQKLQELWTCDEELAIDIIMRLDAERARKVMDRNSKVLKRFLGQFNLRGDDKQYDFLMDGVGNGILKPNDIYYNWHERRIYEINQLTTATTKRV